MAAEKEELSKSDIARYGRQLILPEWGVQSQVKIKQSSLLIVGAGGLGCPAAQYLAAAGVGHIGIVDYDEVEISNLHRQILHVEGRVGVAKVKSAQQSIENIKVTCHHLLLDSSNALEIIKNYDVVLDATDNIATRYLLNDSCVLLHKPLVSGSALRFEGQLTVYNHNHGPCYRCLFPSPTPPHLVTNCSDGGVIGVVPGIIGSLQALEALKLITGVGDVLSSKLLLFDGLTTEFRLIKLRSRDPQCSVCGDDPAIKCLIDYELFCNSKADDKEMVETLLDEKDRISCQKYKDILDKRVPHVLLDVRERVQYEICHLPNSHNIPLSKLQNSLESVCLELTDLITTEPAVPLYVICRRGNDSQLAVKLLQERLSGCVQDVIGGLAEWSDVIDSEFPKY